MAEKAKRLLISFQFVPEDADNQAFAQDPTFPKYRFLRGIRTYFASLGVDVCTIDMWHKVPFDFALFMDVSWRSALSDPFRGHVPRSKRALALIEPPNINPAPYYLRSLRELFPIIFTWSEPLLTRYAYTRIAPMMGVDLNDYLNPHGPTVPFHARRFLVAINSNRWAYHPHSQYNFRKRCFTFFEKNIGDEFDLYGYGWNQPSIFYERWTGYPVFQCYRGVIQGEYDSKIPVFNRYRFSLCVENTVTDPGYVSEKLIDMFCGRCVPVYYGWEGASSRVPKECFINLRDFPTLDDLLAFLRGIDAKRYGEYLDAIHAFLRSPDAKSFRDENLYRIFFNRLYEGRDPSAGLLD
jgi:hypothetical protein